MDLDILNVFEPKVRKNIIDFCKDLNATKADLYVVMARKAACLVSVLEKLSLLTLRGEVMSERVLDCSIDWSRYKSVIIIDDVVISGTTLYQTIEKIKSANSSIQLDLYVLGVNKEWYNNTVLERFDGISYIHSPIRYFDNSECIRLSGDIVRMLAQYPVPYNIDFPIYNTLRLNSEEYKEVMTLPGWKISEVLSFSHEKNDVFTHTFIPQLETLEDCGMLYLSPALTHSLLKIRTYCRCRTDKKHEAYLLTIVPMLIMPPVEACVLDDVFNELIGENNGNLAEVMNSNTSRLRFVQFVLADLLARHFIHAINRMLGVDNEVSREYGSLRYLFPYYAVNKISEIADSFEGVLNVTIPYIHQESKSKGFSVSELLDINDVLSKPFMGMYYQEELQSRQLVRKNGKNVFNDSSYTTAIDRLKRGVSLSELVNELGGMEERLKISFVSAFLDRAIDEGIVVPITVDKEGLVYRAFRHGEDVQFGQQEERLCYDMLSVFAKQIKRVEIPKLWVEKMMVLLFQLGEGDVFSPIQTSLESYGGINSVSKSFDVASVRYYLQGPLVVRVPKDSPFEKQYLEYKDKTDWMSLKMVSSSYSPLKQVESGMFSFDETQYGLLSTGDNQIVIDNKKTTFARNVGLLFGKLLANDSQNKQPSLTSDDLVLLTTSLETRNVIGALAAEMNICYGQFTRNDDTNVNEILIGIRDKRINAVDGFERIRKNVWYQALNDGIRKFSWYCDQTGYTIINDIAAHFDDDLYKTTWESLWSLNMENRGNSEKEETVNMATVEGLWLLCTHAYYSMFQCLIEIEGNYREKANVSISKVRELYSKLNKHAKHYYVKDILPIIAEFLVNYNSVQYARVNVPVILERLVVLFNRCPNLLASASEFYRNSLSVPQMRFFNHALYFETESIEEFRFVKNLYENIRFKLGKAQDKGGTEILMIRDSDDTLPLRSNQCVFISNGETGLFWLLQLVAEAGSVFRGRCGLRMVLYSHLHPDCHIKALSGSRYECQSFQDLLFGTSEMVNKLMFGIDTLFVLSESNNDIRRIHSRFNKHRQEYVEQHEFYLPNKRDYKLYKYQYMDVSLLQKVDIGIITIVDEEAAAVREGFGMNIAESIVVNDHYYDIGVFAVNGKSYKIVHCQCVRQGNTSMAIAALDVSKYFNPDSMVLLGIAGGIQDDINIGDVVIAEDVFYYDSRKEKEGGVVDRRLRSYVNSTKMNSQIVRYRSITSQPNEDDLFSYTKKFALHVAPIGTGGAVIGDSLSNIKQWLLSVHSKTSAVETEAAGFSEAIQDSLNGKVDYLIIRGISDKADVAKDDKYRRIASDNAVIVLKDFIDKIISRLP